MSATARHAGYQLVDLEGKSHEIIFHKLVSRPTFVNTSAGTGPEGICFYEMQDGTKYFREVTVNTATAILASYDLWEQKGNHPMRRRW